MLGAALFSFSVSVKMNTLLFAPGFALIYFQAIGLLGSIKCASLVLAIQLILAAPFISTYPESYLTRAFELSRKFIYHWSYYKLT
jgi:alpha-1,3-mannosyltransferase